MGFKAGRTDPVDRMYLPPEAVPQVVMDTGHLGSQSLRWDVGPISLDGSSVLYLPLVWKSGIIPSGS